MCELKKSFFRKIKVKNCKKYFDVENSLRKDKTI